MQSIILMLKPPFEIQPIAANQCPAVTWRAAALLRTIQMNQVNVRCFQANVWESSH